MDLTYGSLFSGIGGLDLAVEATLGARAVFHSEIDRHPAAVLEAHWPGVPNIGDITEVDWKEVASMAAHARHEQAAQMYALYRQGFSCTEVGERFGRSRQAVWEMFKRRGWDLRPRPPARPTVEFAGRKFSIHDWDVHHINHDRTDNRLENLQALPKADHTRLHGEVMPEEPTVDILCGGFP